MTMHAFDEMTEPELTELFERVARRVRGMLPPDTGFILLAAPYGSDAGAQYVANCERDGAVRWLRETADRLDANDEVPRRDWR